MLHTLIKKSCIVFLIVALFFSGFDPRAFIYGVESIVEGFSPKVVDKMYMASRNKNVVDRFFKQTESAYAAVNSAEKEYMVDIGPVNGSTTANYVYAAFFNPSGSGKTASIKRIAVRANTASSTASNYVNLTVRRITAASGGTQISATNFPQKNTLASSSVIEIRYGGATSTLAGTVDSRILGQPLSGPVGGRFSYRDIQFGSNDEDIVIKPGEGLVVYQEAAGTAATKVRVLIEWDETANAPPSSD
jgi:hypothetical protein